VSATEKAKGKAEAAKGKVKKGTGKAVGNDAARGKKSLPWVLAAERAWTIDDARVRGAIKNIAEHYAHHALDRVRGTAIADDAATRLEAIAEYILGREE